MDTRRIAISNGVSCNDLGHGLDNGDSTLLVGAAISASGYCIISYGYIGFIPSQEVIPLLKWFCNNIVCNQEP